MENSMPDSLSDSVKHGLHHCEYSICLARQNGFGKGELRWTSPTAPMGKVEQLPSWYIIFQHNLITVSLFSFQLRWLPLRRVLLQYDAARPQAQRWFAFLCLLRAKTTKAKRTQVWLPGCCDLDPIRLPLFFEAWKDNYIPHASRPFPILSQCSWDEFSSSSNFPTPRFSLCLSSHCLI